MRRIRSMLPGLLLVVALLIQPSTPALAQQGEDGGRPALQPGVTVTFTQDIPVNIVLVGYTPSMIQTGDLLGKLPASYKPIVREPDFYKAQARNIALQYKYHYRVVFAPPKLQDNLFRYLAQQGKPGDLNYYQQQYNLQPKHVLTVTGPVLYIDGPKTEKWLEDHSEDLLGHDDKSYTVFFLNWYGRPDFRFHLYTKTDQVDPDTGVNFGLVRESRKMNGWGGSSGRTWFYDLSAGPDGVNGTWNVTDADIDGDGGTDYRVPVIWEYRNGGFRDPSALSGDLGLVTRYVAIDLLFTSSPLYDPMNVRPGLGGDRVAYVTFFEDDPASNGAKYFNLDFLAKGLRDLMPYYHWQFGTRDVNPIDPATKRAYDIATLQLKEDDCWNPYGFQFAEFYCYLGPHSSEWVPAYPPADDVGRIFAFNSPGPDLPYGILGLADDDYVTGRQTFGYIFDTPYYLDRGYGNTDDAMHELMHYWGLSHPHDGYDSTTGTEFGPGDNTYFAWAGDQSFTTMSYLHVSYGFGQFNRDNLYRWEFEGYLNAANQLLGEIQSNPNSGKVTDLVHKAQDQAGKAEHGFTDWNYLEAAGNAHDAYYTLAEAASKIGVPLQQAQPQQNLAPMRHMPRNVDPVPSPDN